MKKQNKNKFRDLNEEAREAFGTKKRFGKAIKSRKWKTTDLGGGWILTEKDGSVRITVPVKIEDSLAEELWKKAK